MSETYRMFGKEGSLRPLQAIAKEIVSENNLLKIKAAELERRLAQVAAPSPAAEKPKADAVGYVIQRPVKPLIRIRRLEKAKQRAMEMAKKEGRRAQVLALIAVGTAAPGAEWLEGKV